LGCSGYDDYFAALWNLVDSLLVLHGILVGVVAMLLYVGLTRGRPEPPAYLVAHVLKILGGAAGGFSAERRRKAMSGATADVV
jgi:hypothetical protein